MADNYLLKNDIERFMAAQLEELRAEIARRRAQLPVTMQDCTIQFKECDVGHGWLTATNWIDHGCPQCEIERLRAALNAMLHDDNDLPDGREIRRIRNIGRIALEQKADTEPVIGSEKSRGPLGLD